MILDTGTTIITGDNGSGKSIILSDLAISELKHSNIICINNAFTNRFKFRKSNNYHVFKQNSKSIEGIIKELILKNTNKKNNKIHLFTEILEYIGFKGEIKLTFKIFPYEDFIKNFQSNIYNKKVNNLENENDISQIVNFLQKRMKFIPNGNYPFRIKKEPILLTFHYTFGFQWDGQAQKDPVELFLTYEKELKKSSLLSQTIITLNKNNDNISVNKLSSGESNYLKMLGFILSHLHDNTSIFVDEPENSLHPRWQKKFVSNIFDVLNYFDIKLIIATHSPMITIGAIEEHTNLKLFKSEKLSLTQLKANETNIDEVMVDVFGVLTSRSRYFSYKVNQLLTLLTEGEISLSETVTELNMLNKLGPDASQKKIIEAAHALAEEIIKNA